MSFGEERVWWETWGVGEREEQQRTTVWLYEQAGV